MVRLYIWALIVDQSYTSREGWVAATDVSSVTFLKRIYPYAVYVMYKRLMCDTKGTTTNTDTFTTRDAYVT